MSKIEFDTKVSSIVAFEEKTGKSIMQVFQPDQMSLSLVVNLVKCCAKGEVSDADIDQYVKENGFTKLVAELVSNLQSSGFLGADGDTEEDDDTEKK